MATNPSIILSGSNVNDVINDQRAKIAQAQAQQGAQQLQDLQVAQAKQDFQDQQILKQAWRASQGDPTATAAAAAKMGASQKALTAFQASQLKIQNDYADLHKKKVDADKTELDMLDSKHKGFADLLDAPANAAPAEFQTKFNRSIQTALNLGKISPAEAQQYGNYTQDQVKDLQAGFLGALANSEIAKNASDIDKNKAEIDSSKATLGGKVADGIIKQKAALSGELEQAYTSGGADAYGKVLAAKDPNGTLGFASPDALKNAPSTAAGVAAIRGNAMDAAQKTQAEQAAKNEADAQANRAEQLKLQRISTNIQQQHLNLDYAKTQAAQFAAGLGADGKPLAGQGADLLKTATQNTSDGRVFVDQDAAFKALPKGDQQALRQTAAANGVPLLTGKEAASVKDADTARNTVLGVFNTFMQNSSDHNGMIAGTGRYLINKATTVTGNNPELDAANNNFLATIEALKAAGGANSGLRITGAEITKMYAMKPQLSDSQQTLQAKMGQINELLQSKINGAMHQVPVTSGSKAAAPATSTKVLEIGSQKQYDALPSGAIYTENGVKYRKP